MKIKFHTTLEELKAAVIATFLVFLAVFISTAAPIVQNYQEEDAIVYSELEEEKRLENKEVKEEKKEFEENKTFIHLSFNSTFLKAQALSYSVIQSKSQIIFFQCQAEAIPKYILYSQLLLDY
jgi:hypothetical protein